MKRPCCTLDWRCAQGRCKAHDGYIEREAIRAFFDSSLAFPLTLLTAALAVALFFSFVPMWPAWGL